MNRCCSIFKDRRALPRRFDPALPQRLISLPHTLTFVNTFFENFPIFFENLFSYENQPPKPLFQYRSLRSANIPYYVDNSPQAPYILWFCPLFSHTA